jgi:hypothetical protein
MTLVLSTEELTVETILPISISPRSQVKCLKKFALLTHVTVHIILFITPISYENSHQFEPAILYVVWSLHAQVKQGPPKR